MITPSVAARLVSNESTSLDVPAIQFGGNRSYGIEDTKHFVIWLSEKKLNSLSRSTILDNPHRCFYEIWQQQNFATFFNPWKPLLNFGHKWHLKSTLKNQKPRILYLFPRGKCRKTIKVVKVRVKCAPVTGAAKGILKTADVC